MNEPQYRLADRLTALLILACICLSGCFAFAALHHLANDTYRGILYVIVATITGLAAYRLTDLLPRP